MLPGTNIPDEPGVYQLTLRLEHSREIAVGRLGVFVFPSGRYVYTGSALGGLRQRVGRHLRQSRTMRWHIDYLLEHARVEVVETWPTRERLECEVNCRVLDKPGARVLVRGFGSSDCRCPAHLVYLDDAR